MCIIMYFVQLIVMSMIANQDMKHGILALIQNSDAQTDTSSLESLLVLLV